MKIPGHLSSTSPKEPKVSKVAKSTNEDSIVIPIPLKGPVRCTVSLRFFVLPWPAKGFLDEEEVSCHFPTVL